MSSIIFGKSASKSKTSMIKMASPKVKSPKVKSPKVSMSLHKSKSKY